MDRKDFLLTLTGRTEGRRGSPLGLDPYDGPWTSVQARHLLRRCTFGFPPDALQPFVAMGMEAAVQQLLTFGPPPAPPVNVYSTAQQPDPDVGYGQSWVNAAYNPALPLAYYQARTDTLKAWWAGLMLQGPLDLSEKMTLFWHNHFAVEADTVGLAQALYHYLSTLRTHALGNFRTLLKAVTLDPAMLRYLNGYLNAKAQPDENYARELQELFTVGKGPGSQFTEEDVKAAARVLTGHRVNPLTGPFSHFFDFTQHDTGNKTFSAFYGNKVITGKIGPAGAGETDELIDMILGTPEAARFLCRKLYRFFVYHHIDEQVEENVIAPLADLFRNGDYEILPVMETLLRSQHFHDELQRGSVIRSPLDFTVGLNRQFKVPFPGPSADPLPLYLQWGVNAAWAASGGLNLLDPPVVAGWPAWYQAPMYHRVWINSDTLASRFLLVNKLTGSGVDLNGTLLKLDPIPFTEALPDPVDPSSLVADAADALFALPVTPSTLDYFKSFLLGGLDDSYWSGLWNAYQANPNDPVNANGVRTRLSSLYREMLHRAEHHLS